MLVLKAPFRSLLPLKGKRPLIPFLFSSEEKKNLPIYCNAVGIPKPSMYLHLVIKWVVLETTFKRTFKLNHLLVKVIFFSL